MEQQIERMKELSRTLKEASRAYYQENKELMSNYQYDSLYDELEKLEKETGIVLAGSPTREVGYEAVEELAKERHASPMLSLDKTKEVETLESFAGDQTVLVSWKLDGLTVVLTYENGRLAKAVTRGNGEVGEVVTNNARVFSNIPLQISYRGTLTLRGEAVITYSDFEKINQEIGDVDAKYKNPRNLCSGSVRQLNNEITARRNVRFYAFALVSAPDVSFDNSRERQFQWLKEQGFEVVEYQKTDRAGMRKTVEWFADQILRYDVPSDGLVATYDDIAYGQSLGRTAKFPRDSIAFKWKDEIRETTLREIEWSPSRTGLINPVAIFDPVELEGTTVSRASVHNLSVMRSLGLGIGDRITVYKANMIIPQIAENLTRSGNLELPKVCPACGGPVQIRSLNEAETLYCPNEACSAKRIKAFTLFVSRDALNIEGLSQATLEKLIGHGFLHSFADIYHLERFRERIVKLEGFGEKSFDNLQESIEASRNTTLPRLLYALGIPGIGTANARLICRNFQYDWEKIRSCTVEEVAAIDGMGEITAQAFCGYFEDARNQELLHALERELTIREPEENQNPQSLQGKTFVITGSVLQFPNRSALKAYIEERGGKVTGSVTGKTDYLINNDTASGSSKNRKAKELKIPILSEEDFLKLAEGGDKHADQSAE